MSRIWGGENGIGQKREKEVGQWVKEKKKTGNGAASTTYWGKSRGKMGSHSMWGRIRSFGGRRPGLKRCKGRLVWLPRWSEEFKAKLIKKKKAKVVKKRSGPGRRIKVTS